MEEKMGKDYYRRLAMMSNTRKSGSHQNLQMRNAMEIDDPKKFINGTVEQIKKGAHKKLKTIWIESSGCFGEVISFLNGDDPDIVYWLTEMVVPFTGALWQTKERQPTSRL